MKNVLEANTWSAGKAGRKTARAGTASGAGAVPEAKGDGYVPDDGRAKRRSLNIWFDKRFAANLGTIEMLYERFELEAERREWEVSLHQDDWYTSSSSWDSGARKSLPGSSPPAGREVERTSG